MSSVPSPVASWLRILGQVALSALLGAAVAVLLVQPSLQRLQSGMSRLEARLEATTPEAPVEVIPLQKNDVYPGLPASLRVGRASPTLPLFRLDSRSADELVYAQESVAPAIALTADGWLVTSGAGMTPARVQELAVGWKGRLYQPVRVIRDASTGLVYLRIAVTDLPAAALVSRLDVELGEPVWLESSAQQYAPNTLVRLGMATSSQLTYSSDQWNRRYFLAYPTLASFASVWNERGQLVGFAEGAKGEVLPADAIRTALAGLLNRGEIRRPSLGVRYVDLNETYTKQTERASPQKGALLRADKRASLPAVMPTGPAKAVLREGDVIERIDRDILDGTWTLAERVLEYLPGASVTIAGTRQGKPFEVPVIFGDVVTSEVLK